MSLGEMMRWVLIAQWFVGRAGVEHITGECHHQVKQTAVLLQIRQGPRLGGNVHIRHVRLDTGYLLPV